jgi:hypothetical protein
VEGLRHFRQKFPLVFNGGGKVSLDHLLLKFSGRDSLLTDRTCDLQAAGWTLAVLGVTLLFVMPVTGLIILGAAFTGLIASQFLN